MRIRVTLLFAVVAAWSIVGNASVLSLCGSDDADGYLVCPGGTASGIGTSDATLQLSGTQYQSPGHIIGEITADTPLDPNIKYINSINNETAYAWTSLTVNYYLDIPTPYTISSGSLALSPPPEAYLDSNNSPWTGAVALQINPGLPQLVTIGAATYHEYKGQIVYTGGEAVQVGDALDFTYYLKSLAGQTTYMYRQEMIPTLAPVPEPTTLALLGAVAPALAFLVWRRRAR
jgi:hypothetical protein